MVVLRGKLFGAYPDAALGDRLDARELQTWLRALPGQKAKLARTGLRGGDGGPRGRGTAPRAGRSPEEKLDITSKIFCRNSCVTLSLICPLFLAG